MAELRMTTPPLAADSFVIPDVIVDEDVSAGADKEWVLPTFEQERDMYGKPRRIHKGDLDRLITNNYLDGRSVSRNLMETLPTPLQNENSMNVNLSKSLNEEMPDKSGDSGEAKKPANRTMPTFDLERQIYGEPVAVTQDNLSRVSNNFRDSVTTNANTAAGNIEAAEEVPARSVENSMKVEVSVGTEHKVKGGKQKNKKKPKSKLDVFSKCMSSSKKSDASSSKKTRAAFSGISKNSDKSSSKKTGEGSSKKADKSSSKKTGEGSPKKTDRSSSKKNGEGSSKKSSEASSKKNSEASSKKSDKSSSKKSGVCRSKKTDKSSSK